MVFELWFSERESSYLYLGRGNSYDKEINRHKTATPDSILVWSYRAKTYFEAMQAYYDYLGFGEYKPEPGWQDIEYE